MILRGSLKPEAFIATIDSTIAADSHGRRGAEYLTREAIESSGDGAIYLGGGYWRAIPVWDADDQLFGVRLINPDRTAEECAAVERGIAILRHLQVR